MIPMCFAAGLWGAFVYSMRESTPLFSRSREIDRHGETGQDRGDRNARQGGQSRREKVGQDRLVEANRHLEVSCVKSV